jgi:hypothetical protein
MPASMHRHRSSNNAPLTACLTLIFSLPGTVLPVADMPRMLLLAFIPCDICSAERTFGRFALRASSVPKVIAPVRPKVSFD